MQGHNSLAGTGAGLGTRWRGPLICSRRQWGLTSIPGLDASPGVGVEGTVLEWDIWMATP